MGGIAVKWSPRVRRLRAPLCAVAVAPALWATAGDADAQPTLPAGTRVDTVARGLQIPWGVGFAPDGRIYVSERPGRIRVIENGRLRGEPWATLPVAPAGAGLLGLAVSPDYDATRAIYVVGSFATHGDSVFENRLYRLRDVNGRGVDTTLVLDDLPSARAHAGSAVAFGPDGKLYVTLGDAFQPDWAPSLAASNGKILRLEPDGRPATGNPHAGSRIFARGLRNPQGLAWDRVTGTLFATEHGPSAWPWENGRRHDDELNVIVAGADYGWPRLTGVVGEAGARDPIATWTPAIAPSGLALYDGAYAAWRGSLLVGALRGQHLRRLTLERGGPQGWRVVAQEAIQVTDVPVRIRGVFLGRDGHVYVTTADRRTAAGAPDDLLLRIRLPNVPGGSQ